MDLNLSYKQSKNREAVRRRYHLKGYPFKFKCGQELGDLLGLSREEGYAIVDAIIQTMTKALQNGDTILIKGFGTFKPVYVKSYLTKGALRGKYCIPGHWVIRFKPAKQLYRMLTP